MWSGNAGESPARATQGGTEHDVTRKQYLPPCRNLNGMARRGERARPSDQQKRPISREPAHWSITWEIGPSRSPSVPPRPCRGPRCHYFPMSSISIGSVYYYYFI